MADSSSKFTPQTCTLGDEVACPPKSRQVTLRALHNFAFYGSGGGHEQPLHSKCTESFWKTCWVQGHVAPLCGRTRFLVQSGYWEVPYGDLEYALMRIDDILGLHVEEDSQYRGRAPSLYLYTPKFVYVLMGPAPPYEKTWEKTIRSWYLFSHCLLDFVWVDPTQPRPRWWKTKSDWLALQTWYAGVLAQQEKAKRKRKIKAKGKGKDNSKDNGMDNGKDKDNAPSATSAASGSKHKFAGETSADKGKGKAASEGEIEEDEIEEDEIEEDEIEEDEIEDAIQNIEDENEPGRDDDGEDGGKGQTDDVGDTQGDGVHGAPQRITRQSSRQALQVKRIMSSGSQKKTTATAGRTTAAGPSRPVKGAKRTRRARRESDSVSEDSGRGSNAEAKRCRLSYTSAGATQGWPSDPNAKTQRTGIDDPPPVSPSATEAPEVPRPPSSPASSVNSPASAARRKSSSPAKSLSPPRTRVLPPRSRSQEGSNDGPRSSATEDVYKDMERSDIENDPNPPTSPSTLRCPSLAQTAVAQNSAARSTRSPGPSSLTLDSAETDASFALPTFHLPAPPAAPSLPDAGLIETSQKSARPRPTNIATLCNPVPQSEHPVQAEAGSSLAPSTLGSSSGVAPPQPAPIVLPQYSVEPAGGSENLGIKQRQKELDQTPDDLKCVRRRPGP